jgi:CRISPR-associated protein Cmr4
MLAKLIFLHALSPLHAGVGQGIGVIDLPIAREKATGIPYVPGSTLKGVLRDRCDEPAKRERIFGPDSNRAELHAGSLQLSDLRLLLLPVRSVSGTFAWVTSPLLLRRLLRDAGQAVTAQPIPTVVPEPGAMTRCCVAQTGCKLMTSVGNAQKAVLEDLDLVAAPTAEVTQWANWLAPILFGSDVYWKQALEARLCVVHDDVLGFLLATATEIAARIHLDDAKKTVAKGMLWYEEALPAETVLSGLALVTPVKATPDEVFITLDGLIRGALQIGGDATVGRGLSQARLG